MYFVLPGPDGGPVETLRYEALRAGIQDHTLLHLLGQQLGTERAAQVAGRAFAHILRAKSLADFVGADPNHPEALYSLDPADYTAARRVVIEALAGQA